MTLMLILGAVAAFHCLLLLFRCAKFALPVSAALGVAFHLRDCGYGWMAMIGAGWMAGFLIHALGRQIVTGPAPFPIRLAVILLFVGAAASAGYQAAAALAGLGDLDPGTRCWIATLAAAGTGYASWRDILSPVWGTERSTLRA